MQQGSYTDFAKKASYFMEKPTVQNSNIKGCGGLR